MVEQSEFSWALADIADALAGGIELIRKGERIIVPCRIVHVFPFFALWCGVHNGCLNLGSDVAGEKEAHDLVGGEAKRFGGGVCLMGIA